MNTLQDFDGKVVLVTGAAGGIGAEAVVQFAARGARVVAADRQAVDETAAQVREIGGELTACVVDVADPASVDAMIARTVATYGRLDAAFDNAGISHPINAFHEASIDDWHRVISINLTGAFLCMRAQLAQFVAQGDGGAICVTSSGAGVIAAPMQQAYTAAKHGVLGLVKCAAQEYARQHIRVNAILPGPTDTPMMRASMEENPFLKSMVPKITATGQLTAASDVAAAAVFLCSPAAAGVSGVSLVVDEGQLAR